MSTAALLDKKHRMRRATSITLPLGQCQFTGSGLTPWSAQGIPVLGAGAFVIPPTVGVGGYGNPFAYHMPGPSEIYRVYSFLIAYGVVVPTPAQWAANTPITVTMSILVDGLQIYVQQQDLVLTENGGPGGIWIASGTFGSADLINTIDVDRHQILSIMFGLASLTQAQPTTTFLIAGSQIDAFLQPASVPLQSSLGYYIDNK